MEAAGLEVATHPARLDVDDRARAQIDREDGRRHRRHGLVEADRRRHRRRERGVTGQVVLGEGLLDELQAEGVEGRQTRRGVGAARYAPLASTWRARSGPKRPRTAATGSTSQPGLHLQLDPPVPLVDVAPDGGQQLVDGTGHADGHPGGHGVAGRAEQRGERSAVQPSPGVEHRHLQRGLGHPVALHRRRPRCPRRPASRRRPRPASAAGGGRGRGGRRRRTRSCTAAPPGRRTPPSRRRHRSRGGRAACARRPRSRTRCGTA